MGIFSIANQHLRFAIKLAFAIVLALFVSVCWLAAMVIVLRAVH